MKKSTQAKVHRSQKLRVAYSLAAGAAASAFSPSTADAAVQYFAGTGIDVALGGSQNLSIDNEQYPDYPDLQLKNYNFTGGAYQGATVKFGPGRLVGFVAGPNRFYASALDAGFMVDSSSVHPTRFQASLAYGVHNPNAQFTNVTGKFIGLSFPIGGSTPADLRYGWVRVNINSAAGTFKIVDWAYEDQPGIGILTGDIGTSTSPPIVGDYNSDGTVDAADYVVWRKTLGTTNLQANGDDLGDSHGVIDQADYDAWAANFGSTQVSPPGSGAAAQVPEPISLGLLAAGALGISLMRGLRSRTP